MASARRSGAFGMFKNSENLDGTVCMLI
jgi:hypothetical protein